MSKILELLKKRLLLTEIFMWFNHIIFCQEFNWIMSKINFFVQLQINLVFSLGWLALIRSPKLAVFSVSPQSSILEKKKYNKRICLLSDSTFFRYVISQFYSKQAPRRLHLSQLVGSTEKREEPQLSIAGGLSQSSHSVWPEVIYFGGVTLNMITARLQKILQTATFQNWRKKL